MTMEESSQLSLFPEMQPTSLAVKMFTDYCCNGCICTSDKDHDK